MDVKELKRINLMIKYNDMWIFLKCFNLFFNIVLSCSEGVGINCWDVGRNNFIVSVIVIRILLKIKKIVFIDICFIIKVVNI